MTDDATIQTARALREGIAATLAGTPYCFNPDEALVRQLLVSLAKRKQATGVAVCPCRRIPDDPAKLAELACPCREFPQQIAETGRCFCRLIVVRP